MSENVARLRAKLERLRQSGMPTVAESADDDLDLVLAELGLPIEQVRGVLSDLSMGTGNDGAEEYDKACRETCEEVARRLGVTLTPKEAQ